MPTNKTKRKHYVDHRWCASPIPEQAHFLWCHSCQRLIGWDAVLTKPQLRLITRAMKLRDKADSLFQRLSTVGIDPRLLGD